MCGLAGWIGEMRADPGRSALRAMTDAIAHRGPDGEGAFFAGTRDNRFQVALGHRRLAIIDPAGGVQPMYDASGRIALVFNGEIYNFRELRSELEQAGYRFATNSDTEVLIYAYAAWGPDCVARLRGMFAFALWDAGSERLLLARDRFGKKPMFLAEKDGVLFFASEIKAVLAGNPGTRALDTQSVLDYLVYRYVPGPHTLFRGIRKLQPGAYAVWEKDGLRETIYYAPPDQTAQPDPSAPADPVSAFRDRLDEAVRLRMVSDVPFGAFLSGGIDSSAIVALMSRHATEPVRTFSVGFEEAAYS